VVAAGRRRVSPGADFDALLGTGELVRATRTRAHGPEGRLPITPEMLRTEPSGNLFGMTQDAGMGWRPDELGRAQYLIVSTQGGLRDADGSPVALGYHTGHWEIGLLVRAAAETLRAEGGIPFAAYVSDPCDGRTQGTPGMFDSLPYRNDAAMTMRRLIRSLPQRAAVMGIATCDKGLPATMLALAGCRACGTPGGGCQFLGTSATSQVVAEGFGLALPHTALAPSGEPVWLDMARRSARALVRLVDKKIPLSAILTPAALENAMLLHAAFGGSTNLLLHIPALAHAAGLRRPTVDDWIRVNRATARLVDALPNGPRNHPTVQVFMAGGVPEVMLHLRRMGLLALDVVTVSGETLGTVLDWWEQSERRAATRARLRESDGVDPDVVIMSADAARKAGLAPTVVFPSGNVAPQGAVVKATAIDPSLVGADDVYRHRGPARVFTSEVDAIAAIKGQGPRPVQANDVLVLIGAGPLGTGMEETYQLTSALKFIPWGKTVPVVTDARFSGVSTGACIGHVGPEALAGGPLGKLRDGDTIEIVIDRRTRTGTVDLVAVVGDAGGAERALDAAAAAALLASRPSHPHLRPAAGLPDDTRLWAALQQASGGTWGGAVYDVDRIIQVVQAGIAAIDGNENDGT